MTRLQLFLFLMPFIGSTDLVMGQMAKELTVFNVQKAQQAVAVDENYFYVINNKTITKHDKKNGGLVASCDGTSLGLHHMNSGIVYQGKLYCAHSNFPKLPMASSIEVFDTQTMKHESSYSLGISVYGSLTWIDYDEQSNQWYMGFAHYSSEKLRTDERDNRWTTLVQYDHNWNSKQAWVFPEHIIKAFKDYSNSGGSIGSDGYFYCTGHDNGELYVLEIPKSGYTLQHIATITAPIHGQGLAIDRSIKDALVFYGIRRAENAVVSFRIDN